MAGTVESRYRGETGQRYQQHKRAVPEAAYPWVARLRAEKFAFIGPDETVIELGAGLGWNLANLRCARRIATDLENFLPDDLRKSGVEFVPTSSALPDNIADTVICHHVLEHVENPPEMLREAGRLLKPRGRLLIFVPFEKEARYRVFQPKEPNFHLYSWNAQTLGNLIVSQGFSLEQCAVGRFGYDRFAAKLAIRCHLGENGFRLIRRLAHLLQPGLEVRAVAVKPVDSQKA